MGASLDDMAFMHDQDLVGIHHGRQAMGDDQGRAPDSDLLELALDKEQFLCQTVLNLGQL